MAVTVMAVTVNALGINKCWAAQSTTLSNMHSGHTILPAFNFVQLSDCQHSIYCQHSILSNCQIVQLSDCHYCFYCQHSTAIASTMLPAVGIKKSLYCQHWILSWLHQMKFKCWGAQSCRLWASHGSLGPGAEGPRGLPDDTNVDCTCCPAADIPHMMYEITYFLI